MAMMVIVMRKTVEVIFSQFLVAIESNFICENSNEIFTIFIPIFHSRYEISFLKCCYFHTIVNLKTNRLNSYVEAIKSFQSYSQNKSYNLTKSLVI